jgi:hypothetical protein
MKIDNPLIGNGDVESAVDLLYHLNYIGRAKNQSTQTLDPQKFQLYEQFKKDLSYDKILPQCILVDPKLLATFHCCYGENVITFSYDLLNRILSTKLGGANESLQDEFDPYSVFLSFKTDNNINGLKTLWLWQCQRLIISRTRYSYALIVEIAYNWVRFLVERENASYQVYISFIGAQEVLEVAFGDEIRRVHGAPVSVGLDLGEWRNVLGGGHYAEVKGPEVLNFRYVSPLDRIASQFQIKKLYLDNQRTFNSDPAEFDAAFISSRPFKFSLTTNMAHHLKFNDNENILLYFDNQVYPGSRGIIFDGNVIADG